jgi:hypothetical protein
MAYGGKNEQADAQRNRDADLPSGCASHKMPPQSRQSRKKSLIDDSHRFG